MLLYIEKNFKFILVMFLKILLHLQCSWKYSGRENAAHFLYLLLQNAYIKISKLFSYEFKYQKKKETKKLFS